MVQRWISFILLIGLIGVAFYTISNELSSNHSVEENVLSSEEVNNTPQLPEGLKVGEVAPDFTLQTLDGKTVALSELRGKKVFVNFWATWCPPCKEEMPEMQSFYEKYKDEVVILAINYTTTESGKEKVSSFIQEYGYTFSVLLDPEDEATKPYRAVALPTTYFIGTDGKIQLERHVGPLTEEMMIEKMNELS
ncbi:TlpA disulfide reductase family protein [Bacillaceae bacterium S4-13-56]